MNRFTAFVKSHAWLWFVIMVLTLFLGTRGLNEPDEGRYAEIAREMADSGDWLIPTLNGFEHFQKPPFFYWVTAASLKVFAYNEWAARLPSALAAFGVVILTYLIARKLFSERTARHAAIVLVSGVEFFALARLVTPDMTMSFWIVLAIAAFIHERRWPFFVAMGLGFLTKGPMALLVPLASCMVFHYTRRREASRMQVPWVRGFIITFGIGFSWFIALSLWRAELFEYFWRYELVQRFGSAKHGRSQPWWFFFPVLILALTPWTPFLIKPALQAWRRLKSRTLEPRHVLLAAWIAIPLLVLSCSGSKLLTYVLPLLPAFAIVLGGALQSTKRVWTIALVSAACWLVVAACADRFSPMLERQASIRSLATLLKETEETKDAELFICGVRAHGFAFYMNDLVSITKGDADIVLPLDASDKARVYKSVAHCARSLSGGRLAYGIVDRERFEHTFKPQGWTLIGDEGDFVLITNEHAPALVLAR
ncbi:glycosyltransferase family 39 protein [Roseimicrobium sp. ORNL1]|uniref:glycosyltransferase family 39 protein n=1 Tax=Roseimicrobium sp. ORNL1 TaxID=2711231 RepID=UPI0013E14241|nr:glycosyltransferase family 39 protein [Roseimicrobium sp. ORNL1]QIF03815.1 glycosyltransferase family 39 protein [Roseimicrobium sp. ORNL1]